MLTGAIRFNLSGLRRLKLTLRTVSLMVKRSRGYRSRTRNVLKKHPRKRGLFPPARILYEYKEGEKVAIIIDPSVHKGMPHRRYHGKVGTVVGKRGRAYVVHVRDGGKIKTLIVRPEHLRPLTPAQQGFVHPVEAKSSS